MTVSARVGWMGAFAGMVFQCHTCDPDGKNTAFFAASEGNEQAVDQATAAAEIHLSQLDS